MGTMGCDKWGETGGVRLTLLRQIDARLRLGLEEGLEDTARLIRKEKVACGTREHWRVMRGNIFM